MEKEHQAKKLKKTASTQSLSSTPPASLDEIAVPQRKPTVKELACELEGFMVMLTDLQDSITRLRETVTRQQSILTDLQRDIVALKCTSATPVANFTSTESFPTGSKDSKPAKGTNTKTEQFLNEFFDDYCAVCEDFGHVTVPACRGL